MEKLAVPIIVYRNVNYQSVLKFSPVYHKNMQKTYSKKEICYKVHSLLSSLNIAPHQSELDFSTINKGANLQKTTNYQQRAEPTYVHMCYLFVFVINNYRNIL